jgi:hypothetical protein
MFDFSPVGAWFDQDGKDVGKVLQDGPKDIVVGIVPGDVIEGIVKAPDELVQVVYDVFNPDNPDPNSVVDQIETTLN